jgi:hypothetical protein
MALIPKITAYFKENNTLLSITDITGVYSAGNVGGYGTPNDDSTDITSAIVKVTYPNGTIQLEDVTSQINAQSVAGNYVFTNITPSSTTDGIHKFMYTVVAGGTTYTFNVKKLMLGKARCCLDKLQVKLVDQLCEECETSAYANRVDLAESLYNSALAMGGCYKINSITKILTKLQVLCDFEGCNCN